MDRFVDHFLDRWWWSARGRLPSDDLRKQSYSPTLQLVSLGSAANWQSRPREDVVMSAKQSFNVRNHRTPATRGAAASC
jgi:hypothetical protein